MPTTASASEHTFTLEIHADGSIKAIWQTADPDHRADGRLAADDESVRKDIKLDSAHAQSGQLDDRERMKRLGEKMYATLFPGQVGALFEDAIKQVRAARTQDRNCRLRVTLDVDPRSAVAREGWPLEFLYSPSAEWLATSPYLALYRRLKTPPAHQPGSGKERLNVLLIVSLPEGLGGTVTPEFLAALGKAACSVEGAGEQARMQLRLLGLLPGASGGGAVELLGLPATYANIKEQIESWAPDVVHFIGHGQLENPAAQGELALFDDDERSPRWVPNDVIASLFLGWPPPQVVMLQGCEGACSGTEPAFMDMVNRLVDKQIPALVTTQFTLTNRYATIFAAAFYKALCGSDDVDAAVQSGRAAISSASLWTDHAFATPVLFTYKPWVVLPPRPGGKGPRGPAAGPAGPPDSRALACKRIGELLEELGKPQPNIHIVQSEIQIVQKHVSAIISAGLLSTDEAGTVALLMAHIEDCLTEDRTGAVVFLEKLIKFLQPQAQVPALGGPEAKPAAASTPFSAPVTALGSAPEAAEAQKAAAPGGVAAKAEPQQTLTSGSPPSPAPSAAPQPLGGSPPSPAPGAPPQLPAGALTLGAAPARPAAAGPPRSGDRPAPPPLARAGIAGAPAARPADDPKHGLLSRMAGWLTKPTGPTRSARTKAN